MILEFATVVVWNDPDCVHKVKRQVLHFFTEEQANKQREELALYYMRLGYTRTAVDTLVKKGVPNVFINVKHDIVQDEVVKYK